MNAALQKGLSLSKTHSLGGVTLHATSRHRSSLSPRVSGQRSGEGLQLYAPPVVLSAVGQQHAEGGPELSYRVYKYDSQAFSQVSLGDAAVKSALAQAPSSDTWEVILGPETPLAQRTQRIAEAFSITLADPAEPMEGLEMQPELTGVVFMTPGSPASDASTTTNASQKSLWGGAYGVRKVGEEGSLEHRVFVQRDGQDISPWHDIPLFNSDGTINFLCEIPKETKRKMEVATAEADNPVKQDVKKGKPREYHEHISWNYGMIPQTWEDPAHKDPRVGDFGGDNDPVDVIEIGSTALATGGVYAVKVLGAYSMIDGGELDWKMVCIAAEDPLAAQLNNIEDVERVLPGELEKILFWFRDYKIPDGKPPNTFGFSNRPCNAETARGVIQEAHEHYKALVDGSTPNIGELSLT